MRDAQSALDQVIAFAGDTVTADDVARCSVWSAAICCSRSSTRSRAKTRRRVRRSPARAVEAGYDLRIVCRELARLMRDLLVADDRSLARLRSGNRRRGRARARCRAGRTVLARGPDARVRRAGEGGGRYPRRRSQPRHHFEMALVKWIHLRKLVPLDRSDRSDAGRRRSVAARRRSPVARGASAPAARAGGRASSGSSRGRARACARRRGPARSDQRRRTVRRRRPASDTGRRRPTARRSTAGRSEGALLGEIRKPNKFFYGMVVAQAQKIDVDGDTRRLHVRPAAQALRAQLEANAPGSRAGRSAARRTQDAGRRPREGAGRATAAVRRRSRRSRRPAGEAADAPPTRSVAQGARAADAGVQAMLDVFPAEIEDVEEIVRSL